MTRIAFVGTAFTLAMLIVACSAESVSSLRTALDLEAKGDHVAAISILTRALGAQQDDGVLRYHRGRLYGMTFDAPAAEHDLRKARELGVVEGGRVVMALGRALLAQGKLTELVEELVPSPAFEQGILASIHALRGHALLSLDRIVETKNEFGTAERIEADNADVTLLRARIMASARDLTGALGVVEALIARDAGNVDARMHKAELLRLLRRPTEAIDVYVNVLERQARHRDALVGRAALLIQTERFADALRDVEALRETYPRYRMTGFLRGQIHFWRGEYREALDFAQIALRADQDDAYARLLSGMANLGLGAGVAAEHDLTRYLALDPSDGTVRRLLVELQAELRRKARAVRALPSIFSVELREVIAGALLGEAYAKVWRYSKLAQWLERLAVSTAHNPGLAVRYLQQRFPGVQLQQAITDLERVAALTSTVVPADVALVLALLAQRDFPAAANALATMQRKAPDAAHVEYLVGIVSLEQNRTEAAAERFEHVLQRDPSYVAAAISLARLEVAAGRVVSARKRLEGVLRASGHDLQASLALAELEFRLGRRGEAYALVKQVIDAYPSALEPRVALVALYTAAGEMARARPLSEELVALAPEDPLAIEVAADVRLRDGDMEGALQLFNRFIVARPRAPESHFKLAYAQYRAGRAAEAQFTLDQSLSLPGDDPESRSLRAAGILLDQATWKAIEATRKHHQARPNRSGPEVSGQPLSPGIVDSVLKDVLSNVGGARDGGR